MIVEQQLVNCDHTVPCDTGAIKRKVVVFDTPSSFVLCAGQLIEQIRLFFSFPFFSSPPPPLRRLLAFNLIFLAKLFFSVATRANGLPARHRQS